MLKKSTALEKTFDELLHQLRGEELRRLGGLIRGSACHVGCAGGWYFDWLAGFFPNITENVGVEYYLEVPENLPKM
jgi:hypothetical protein